ncbi:MAG: FtsX-like permease family protein [Lachnospiraceae bacterium]|nr:FtsX-like permease family protein [Lachnospiraceae bacterium]
MKSRKTLFLEAFRNIKNRFVSFLSIVSIMMIGFAGLMCMFNVAETLKQKGDAYYREHNFKDLEIVASMGITEDDISEVSAIEGVADVEGIFRKEGTLTGKDGNGTITVISETKRIDVPKIVSGEMPVAANECALNASAMKAYGLNIGDTFTAGCGLLKEEEFVITGEADIPQFIGQKEYAMLVSEDAINKDATKDRFTSALIKANINPDISFYSNSYKKKLRVISDRLDEFAEKNGTLRTSEIQEEASGKIEDAENEAGEKLSDAEQKLKDGEKELKEKLAQAEAEIAENEQKLKDGRAQLDSETAKAEKAIADGERELAEKLAQAEKDIAEGRAKADSELAAAYEQLCQGEAAYSGGLSQYEEGKRKYDEGVAQIEDAKAQLAEAKAKIDEGNAQIEEKISEKSGDIDAYSTIIKALTDGMGNVIQRIEDKHPDIKDNEKWKDFCNYVGSLGDLSERVKNASDEERVEILKDVITKMDAYYAELPFSDEVRAEIQALFDEVRAKHPKIDSLAEGIEGVRKLIDGERQYAEAEQKLNEKIEEADLPGNEKKLADAKQQLDEARGKLDSGWTDYVNGKEEANKRIAQALLDYENGKNDGEKKIADAKADLARKKAEGLKKLEDGERELEKGKEDFKWTKEEKEKELADGWETYYEEKDKAEQKLREAREQLAEISTDNYIITSRNLVGSYNEFNTSYNSVSNFELAFLPLFGIVAVMVFFSTIAIIIDEQKKQVGGVKALGFQKGEILVKYLIFAGLGAVIGTIAGTVGGYILTKLVIKPICSNYYFGDVKIAIGYTELIILFVGCVVFGAVVAYFACRKLLKCSAIGLINGSEPASRVMKGRHKGNSRGGALYSRLIINNMKMDRERVLVSVIVIIGSCCLIGFGFTTRNAFNESMNRQLNTINNYTLQTQFEDGDTESMEKVEKLVEDLGGSYAECHYMLSLLDLFKEEEAMYVISAPSDEIKEFITVTDNKGRDIPVPKSGILIPKKAFERLKSAKEIKLYDGKMYSYKAEVAGTYTQYLGFVALTTPEGYEEIFGEDYKPNSLFIKCDDVEALENGIAEISEDIKVVRKDYLVTKGETVKKLFDVVTIIVLVLALLLSLMILVNLTNILVNRRMREVLVMRINGFSLSEVIGYVARESLFTFVVGIIFGVICGIIFCIPIVPFMESTQIMYIRTPFAPAWIISVIFNVAFTILIDFIAFRKIAKTPVTDIVNY